MEFRKILRELKRSEKYDSIIESQNDQNKIRLPLKKESQNLITKQSPL